MNTTHERLRRLAAAARSSEALFQADREALQAAVEQADGEGFSVRDIARATGYSSAWVHRTVLLRTAARQARLAAQVP